MDARNAAESDQTRPAGASPRPERQPTPEAKSPRVTPAVGSGSPDRAQQLRRDSLDAPGDLDSDAETIVLPGKDGHSPSKVRKVRQEDRSDGDAEAPKGRTKPASDSAAGHDNSSSKNRKLLSGSHPHDSSKVRASDSDKDGAAGSKDEPAAGTANSTRTSPTRSRHRRRSFSSRSSHSDGERHPKTTLSEKFKSKERLLPHKRKAPRPGSDSDDEQPSNRARRKRTASVSVDDGRLSRERRSSMSKPQHDVRDRSTSPHRVHRRSNSTQMTSLNGPSSKRRRVPPPLQPTDYHSDDSSAGSSPHPRNTKAKSLAASAAGESSASPAKVPSHKKHLDAHGQTLLARACARGEFEGTKKRLRDRPEDLNVADYAGNTPLQIAAINGCEDIVKLLIEAGCNIDCVNYDKDTPLLDAVDNGHLGVVKLLVEAGVNPRKANVNGEEPIDRVTEETDNADEIRTVLLEAKKRFGGRTKTSEDRNYYLDNQEAPDSPRHSPATVMASGRRSGTVRATKTRNDLLYQPLDDRTLLQAAGRGDEEMVARILQVKGSCQDAEPMVAAARGGHDLVIQLLLGLGGANPDPEPIASQPTEFATPILAAIGQENIKVLELLLEQQSVDPTRRYKGETYYEIAKRRQGTNWRDEEQKLKDAYDAYKSSRKPKAKSPGRRDHEREEKRARRDVAGDNRLHKRDPRSPSRDSESRKKMSKLPSPKEKRNSDSQSRPGDDKGATARPRKDDKVSVNTPDREDSPAVPHKHPKTKRTDSEVAASSEGETVKPRRKLVSKGELRGEREKQRRSSVTSATSANKEPASPREPKQDALSDREKVSEKRADRAKSLRKEEGRENASGDSSGKRHRTSLNSDRPHNGDKEDGGAPIKRRRVEGDDGEKRRKHLPSPAGSSRKPTSDVDGHGKSTVKPISEANKPKKTSGGDSAVRIKSEDADVEMPDAGHSKGPSPTADVPEQGGDRASKKKPSEASKADDEALKEKEKERKRAENEKRKREEDAARKAKEEEAAAKKRREEKEEEEREAEKKRREEAERVRREEEQEKKRLADVKARQEAEEKAQREEKERKRREEEKRAKEEEERKRREEEEERHRKEREAAEEARRKREEEERKERERRERAHREEMERKRAAREAEQRRIREEQEQARLDKLPPLLRWLDTCPNPKDPAYAKKLRLLQGARYDTMRPEATGTPEGRELWVLNAHVALILDTDWERVPASHLAKASLWRVESRLYTLTDPDLWEIGCQLPGYYGPGRSGSRGLAPEAHQALVVAARERFFNMDLFFVKASDFLYTVPNIPHLRNVQLAIMYRELAQEDHELKTFKTKQKWKQDPDANRFGGVFGPRNKYYVNGVMVDEDKPVPAVTSKTPFPERRVPRRGLLQVFPDDPDYARICMEQGLGHLVKGHGGQSPVNGVQSPPPSHSADTPRGNDGSSETTHDGADHSGVASIKGTGDATDKSKTGANGSLLNGLDGPDATASRSP
ncbi:Ankyrin repeat [Geosmithia morbida]|uniref:Ankyrin repeat n=1 Tax=Geosmithia morbida TaxID=1094350 RepID=A0A9P5D2W8_9HYPO|nr:Ankyrin repeat [Geosmithia morbida]KAF4121220.1 Ankyrin repeat [Geosmithia morbida]